MNLTAKRPDFPLYMATFTVFSYQFRPLFDGQGSLFPDTYPGPEEVWLNKQVYLRDLFSDKLVFRYRNVSYNHEVLYNENGLIVFKLGNNEKIVQESLFVAKKLDHNPSCSVIIDNRQDVQNIYIEEDEYSFSDSSVVANILEKTFNSYLISSGLGVTINKRFKEHEFWEVIEKAESGIDMLRFTYLYPNLPRVQERIDEMLASTSRGLHSKKTNIEFNSADGEVLHINRDNEDLVNLVRASSESGSSIKVKIKNYRRHTEIGNTSETVEIENLNASLTSDLLSTASQKLVTLLNKFK